MSSLSLVEIGGVDGEIGPKAAGVGVRRQTTAAIFDEIEVK